MFAKIRNITLKTLIVLTVVLTFVSILSIWELIPHDVFSKSLSSLNVFIVSSTLIVLATLAAENKLREMFDHEEKSGILGILWNIGRYLGFAILGVMVIIGLFIIFVF